MHSNGFSNGFEQSGSFGQFSAFLASKGASLEKLSLNHATMKILKTILTKLKVIKSLRTNSTSLSTDKEFYDRFLTITSLKALTLHDAIPSDDSAKGLLRLSPNLEVLKAFHDPRGFIPRLLSFIAVQNPNLRALHVDTLQVVSNDYSTVQFGFSVANLKALAMLHIENFNHPESVLTFLKANPTVATLRLTNIDERLTIKEVFTSFLEVVSLKHLIVTGSVSATKEIFNAIKENYKTLKSLELNVDDTGCTHKMTFHLPQDSSEWDSRCSFFDTVDK